MVAVRPQTLASQWPQTLARVAPDVGPTVAPDPGLVRQIACWERHGRTVVGTGQPQGAANRFAATPARDFTGHGHRGNADGPLWGRALVRPRPRSYTPARGARRGGCAPVAR